MIAILPNWHPIFVHFTVALYLSSSLLFVAGLAFPGRRWTAACLTTAHWNLWLGAVLTIITVAAGIYAFNTVRHDEASHLAMTDHRNWALATAAVWWALALWAVWKARRNPEVRTGFVAAVVLGVGLLGVTGWKGGELVYRYGLGVQSLPDTSADEGTPHGHGGSGTASAPDGKGGSRDP